MTLKPLGFVVARQLAEPLDCLLLVGLGECSAIRQNPASVVLAVAETGDDFALGCDVGGGLTTSFFADFHGSAQDRVCPQSSIKKEPARQGTFGRCFGRNCLCELVF